MNLTDHILAVVKAGFHLVPHVGGSVASLIEDYVPSSTERAIKRSVEQLAQQLKVLGDRVDAEAIDKDDFAELFKSCYLVIVRTNREEKLQAASNLLANLLLKDGDPIKVSYAELDHLVRCLDILSIGAIHVLGAARKISTTSQKTPDGNIG